MILTIIIFIFVLGLLVLVHEFGHFVAAKRAGVKVEEFAFGFPPRLFSRVRGGTRYSINAIPLGGYVKLFGEEGTHLKDPKSFYSKPLGHRFWVIVAGVLMNIILGWFLFTIGYSFGLPVTATNPQNIPNAKITSEIIVAEALPNTPASSAGISKGDTILGANSILFTAPEEMTTFTKANMGQNVKLLVKRYGSVKEINVTLSNTADAPLGVSILESQKVKVPFWQAPITALKEVWNIIVAIFVTIGSFFATLFTTGKASSEGVVGPVGIWFIFQTAVKLGFIYIVQLTALISINLAIINILPFPALDGGRLIFWLVELIRRKRITPRIEGIVHTIGFALLILLILVITFRDIINR